MLWSGVTLPVKVRTEHGWRALPIHDSKVKLLPPHHSSLCALAESFRWIVKHIQTFSVSKLVPSYRKQSSKSLISLSFSSDHEGGVACRPQLPNGPATYNIYKYVQDLVITNRFTQMFRFCHLILLHRKANGPQWQKARYEKQNKFQSRVRYAIRTKKSWTHFYILTIIEPLLG